MVSQRCVISVISGFDFGFPFGVDDLATIKKIPVNLHDKIVIEQAVCMSNLSISDHGANIHIATKFGFCDVVLQRQNMRNIKLQSISQISRHESISLVIKKSVQRGMALAQLKERTAVTDNNFSNTVRPMHSVMR